jgi:parallel beta-helix repeat protein
MHRVGVQFAGFCAVALAALVAMFAFSGIAAAATSCDRVASPSGSDANPGSAEAPFQSPQRLVDSLGSGQTGCFRNGTFAGAGAGEIEVRHPGITLTSYPGERATLKGELKIEKGADGVTVSDVDIDARSRYNLGPMIFAADTTFDNVDVTDYNTGICFILGAADPAYGRAVHTVIQNSRIHNCGTLPATNQDHGIYIEHSDGAIIRNNWIYDNADRGIQLYPDSQGTKIYGNVIDGNGEGVIFSGDEDSASSDNLVYDNVISNSNQRWNVESYWSGPVGTGNVVRDNCIWASNATSQASYYNSGGGVLSHDGGDVGYSTSGNRIVNPRFVDAAANNFNLRDDSPCGTNPPQVTLNSNDKQVKSGAKVNLHGQVTPAQSRHVVIQIIRHGHWRKFASSRVRKNGRFAVHKRLRGRQLANRARLRARVPRVGRSKPIAIKVN